MPGTYQRGQPKQVMIPTALASAVAEGELVAVAANLAVGAGSFTWTTDTTTTRRNFCAAFAGKSAQAKDANANVFGNGDSNKLKVRVDTAGVHRFAVAAGTYNLFDMVGPKKASGNALEPYLLEVVTDPAQAVGQVVGGEGTNPGYVDVDVHSRLLANTGAFGTIEVISLPIQLVAITGAGDVLTDYTPGFNGEILAVDFAVTTKVTTAAKAATLNVEVGTTDVTGGAVALTSANCGTLGAVVAGSAVTALNTFTSADKISVEAASVTAFSEGAGNLLIKVRNRDG